MPSVTELSPRKWEHPPQRRGWSWQDWAILGDNPSAQTSLVTTGAPIQETHPALGMEKLTRAYEAAGWYHLSRKPGKLFDWIAQIVSKPSRTGLGGGASIYYEHVPPSSKYLLWKSLVLTHNRPSDFCRGRLQSACPWVAAVRAGSVLGPTTCRGVSGTSQLTGGKNHKGTLVLKAHQHQPRPSCRVPIQNTCCSETGLIAFARRCWRRTWWWPGQLGCKMLWEGRRPSKNPPVRRREAWRYPGSTAADGRSPAVVKGVRISPSVDILLTPGQALRDAEFSDYLVYNWHSLAYFL